MLASRKVDLEQAIRTRRTHKAYGSEPVPAELFERWGPESHLGPARQEKEPPGRNPPGDYVTFLP